MQAKTGRGKAVVRRTPRQLTNVQLGVADLGFLERRGARAHQGGMAFSRSAVLSRELKVLEALLADADPRAQLAPAVYEAAVAALRRGWTLKPFEVRHLEEVLAGVEELSAVLRGAGIERGAFLAAIAGLSFAGKVALVDRAIQAHGPGASGDERA